MIEDKLEEARLLSARRRMQIVIAVLVTICIVGLVVFGLSVVDFSAGNDPKVIIGKQDDSAIKAQDQVRTQFIENLTQYENELEPRLKAVSLEIWNRDGLFEITELKKEMMLHFSNGEYDKAQGKYELLSGRSSTLLVEAERIFKENIEKAASFFKEDLYDEAKLHIDKALMIVPQSSEALVLKGEIEKLPAILPLLNQAAVARTENDFQNEYNILQQVVNIAPQRQEISSRLEKLGKLLKQQTFETHISSGFTAVEKGLVQKARDHYQKAKKAAPERKELSLLSGKISILERSLRVQKNIKQAEQAIDRGDWLQARDYLARAVKDDPENTIVVEDLRQADLVVDLQGRLAQHIDNPYRLTNDGVRRNAEVVLLQAEPLSRVSYKVKQQVGQLRELMRKLNRQIPVTVISDNKTRVQVRGVGKIGMVSEKIIQLKPGKYTFEGARDGFKSKLVQTFITYDLENFSVRIVCDEQI